MSEDFSTNDDSVNSLEDFDTKKSRENNAFTLDKEDNSENYSFKKQSFPVKEGFAFRKALEQTPFGQQVLQFVKEKMESKEGEEKKEENDQNLSVEKQLENYFETEKEGVFVRHYHKKTFRLDRNQGFAGKNGFNGNRDIISDLRDKIKKDKENIEKLEKDAGKLQRELKSVTNVNKSTKLRASIQAKRNEIEKLRLQAKLHMSQLALLAEKVFSEEQEYQAKIKAEFETVDQVAQKTREALEKGMVAIFTVQENGRRLGGTSATIRPEDQPERWVNKWLEDLNSLQSKERIDQISNFLKGSFEVIKASGIIDTKEWVDLSKELVTNVELNGFENGITEDNIDEFIDAFGKKIENDKQYSSKVIGALTSIVRTNGKANGILSSLLDTLEKKTKKIKENIETFKELSENRRKQISSLANQGKRSFRGRENEIGEQLDSINKNIAVSKTGEQELDSFVKLKDRENKFLLSEQKKAKSEETELKEIPDALSSVYKDSYKKTKQARRAELIKNGMSEEEAEVESEKEADSWLERILKFLFGIPKGKEETEEEKKTMKNNLEKFKKNLRENHPIDESIKNEAEDSIEKKRKEYKDIKEKLEGEDIPGQGNIDEDLLLRNLSEREKKEVATRYEELQKIEEEIKSLTKLKEILDGIDKDTSVEDFLGNDERFLDKVCELEGIEGFDSIKEYVNKKRELATTESEIEKLKDEIMEDSKGNIFIITKEHMESDKLNAVINMYNEYIEQLKNNGKEDKKAETLVTKLQTLKQKEIDCITIQEQKEERIEKLKQKIKEVVPKLSRQAGDVVRELGGQINEKEGRLVAQKEQLRGLFVQKMKEVKHQHRFRNMVNGSRDMDNPPTIGM